MPIMQISDPTYPLFPIFAFFGFILPLIPLRWHLLAWNSGTCYFIFWSSIANLNLFVNSIVWHGNAKNSAPLWCDISIRIMMAASVAIPASSLCINRRLYQIASIRAVSVTRAEKRCAIFIDSLFCVLLPVIFTALRESFLLMLDLSESYRSKCRYVEYVVQGHRFNIYGDFGPFPALYNTALLYILNCIWPVLLGLISAVYCVLSLRSFLQRRADFNSFLSSNRSLTTSRYFRLMALSMTEICCTTPLAITMICINVLGSQVGPWRSWADTHFDYGRVEMFPWLLWRLSPFAIAGLEATRWITVFCSFVFFAFFGFAVEARKHYRMWWNFATSRFSREETQQEKKHRNMNIVAELKMDKSKPLPPGPSTVSPLPLYSSTASTAITCEDGSSTEIDVYTPVDAMFKGTVPSPTESDCSLSSVTEFAARRPTYRYLMHLSK
ncbi:pheromone receptor Rcb2 B44 [Armillaria fumosa]|nr:pheromone receptor Rcb2 B44 [Armillaria fumosa]